MKTGMLLLLMLLAGCSRGPDYLGLRVGDHVACQVERGPLVITKLRESGPFVVESIDQQQIVLTASQPGGMRLYVARHNLAGVVELAD